MLDLGRGMRRPLLIAGSLLLALSLAACGTPRSGPLASQIDPPEAEGELEGLVVPLTAEVVTQANLPAERGFPPAFVEASPIDPELVGIGDEFDVLVWEPGGTALFGGGEGAGTLPAVRVAPDGTIFLPFAGRVRAAGATPAQLRGRIRQALEPYVSAPQVDLRFRSSESKTVSIQGVVAQPGPYVIDRTNTRLLPMLGLAGGVTLEPQRVEVAIRRGETAGAEMLEDIYADPRLNVALRPQDLVVLTPLRQRFIVLGASSSQAQLQFPTRELSLLGALAAAGGLRDFDADPSGVFVFRLEDAAVAETLLAGSEPAWLPDAPGRPVVYRLDLTRPGALFVAEAFAMRDGDAIFATNAPFTEIRKVLQIFTSAIVPVSSTQNLLQ